MNDVEDCMICVGSVNSCDMYQCEYCSVRVCKSCVCRFWTTQIYSGNFDSLRCLGSCIASKELQPSESQIYSVLDGKTYKKLKYFRTNKFISDHSVLKTQPIVFCANEMCLTPILCTDTNTEFVHCSKCEIYFCRFCQQVVKNAQDMTSDEESMNEVLFDPNRIEIREHNEIGNEVEMELKQSHQCRVMLEENVRAQLWCIQGGMNKKNGKKNRMWNVLHTKKCPGCGVRIEKNSGCSHMHCVCCKAHFCWTCRG